MLRKILLHDATDLPHSRPRADKVQRRGHMVDLSWHRAGTWRTHVGHTQGKLRGKHRTHGGHKAVKVDVWRTRCGGAAKADSRQTQGGHEAGRWRTQGGHIADKVWRRGHSGIKADTRRTHGGRKADTRRTHGGQARGTRPEHIAASSFFLRENPTVNCFGKKRKC